MVPSIVKQASARRWVTKPHRIARADMDALSAGHAGCELCDEGSQSGTRHLSNLALVPRQLVAEVKQVLGSGY